MADFTNLPLVSVDDPGTAEWANAVAQNPIAITEGAAGAPRVQDRALSAVVTGDGVGWVAVRVAAMAWNGVGQTVMAYINSDPSPDQVNAGDIRSGSRLNPVNSVGTFIPSVMLPGSWRCQGSIPANADIPTRVTTWLRVS